MGMMLHSRETPADKAKALIAQKETIEAEISVQQEILKSHSANMNTPLVDSEGFPRADIDVWAIRTARVRLIELRNDLSAVMEQITIALQNVYARTADEGQTGTSSDIQISSSSPEPTHVPFARVDGVAPGSPAAEAGMRKEDKVVSFGHLTHISFTSSSLQPLAELVAHRENREINITLLREPQELVSLKLTPRKGWGGRGLLGCHLVPHTS